MMLLLAYTERKDIKIHIGAHPRTYTFILPLLSIIGLFLLFVIYAPLFGDGIESRGQYGDSFGMITSLFTGLGFAGLVITLFFQQLQISRQEADSLDQKANWKEEKINLHAARYEETLHRLLHLYKGSVDSVRISEDGKTRDGLTAIQAENSNLLKLIRIQRAGTVPSLVARNLRRRRLSEEDKRVLDRLFLRNAELINQSLSYQGRLVKTFTLLLLHIEDQKPSEVAVAYPRLLLQSQLTHIEVSYFFYISLAFTREDELRRLLIKSGLLAAFPNVCKLEVHRYLYMHLWGHDPKHEGISHKAPFKQMATSAPGEWEIVDDDLEIQGDS